MSSRTELEIVRELMAFEPRTYCDIAMMCAAERYWDRAHGEKGPTGRAMLKLRKELGRQIHATRQPYYQYHFIPNPFTDEYHYISVVPHADAGVRAYDLTRGRGRSRQQTVRGEIGSAIVRSSSMAIDCPTCREIATNMWNAYLSDQRRKADEDALERAAGDSRLGEQRERHREEALAAADEEGAAILKRYAVTFGGPARRGEED